MTIIAVMNVDDETLLMASDRLVTEEDLQRQAGKLAVLSDQRIVAGFSGDEGVGFQFRRWLMDHEWPEDCSWQEFADVAGQQLSRLNGQRRSRARLAKVESRDDKDITASVLLAGSVGGVLDAWELTYTGGISPIREIGFAGIGSGWPHAYVAYRTLTDYGNLGHEAKTLAVIMEVACRSSPMCEGPIEMLRITKGEIGKLTRGKDGNFEAYEAILP